MQHPPGVQEADGVLGCVAVGSADGDRALPQRDAALLRACGREERGKLLLIQSPVMVAVKAPRGGANEGGAAEVSGSWVVTSWNDGGKAALRPPQLEGGEPVLPGDETFRVQHQIGGAAAAETRPAQAVAQGGERHPAPGGLADVQVRIEAVRGAKCDTGGGRGVRVALPPERMAHRSQRDFHLPAAIRRRLEQHAGMPHTGKLGELGEDVLAAVERLAGDALDAAESERSIRQCLLPPVRERQPDVADGVQDERLAPPYRQAEAHARSGAD